MSIKLCQASGSVVTPLDDSRLYSWLAARTVGIVSGCVVTSAGTNQLSITAGWGICQGHVFVVSAETISAAVASSGTMLGRLLIHIDTSDSTTPVKFVTQAASTLPSLTQEAIDGSGSLYEIPLTTYSVGTISISDLQDVATRLGTIVSAISASPAVWTALPVTAGTVSGSVRPYTFTLPSGAHEIAITLGTHEYAMIDSRVVRAGANAASRWAVQYSDGNIQLNAIAEISIASSAGTITLTTISNTVSSAYVQINELFYR